MALAPAFPGTAWSDPEFAAEVSRPLGFYPQQIVAYGLCAVALVAVALAAAM